MRYRTPMSRVIGLGSAKDGVEHWWSQRLTAIAMIPLTLLAITILFLGWNVWQIIRDRRRVIPRAPQS